MKPWSVFALCASLLLAACCPPPLRGNPELPYPPSRPPGVGDILHLPTGYYVSEPQLLAAVADARLVYAGETHDNPASHRVQLALLKAMADRHPGAVALGMEMFTPAQQPVLDRWVAGELDERSLLKESRWYEQWQMDFDYYRDLLLFARERRIPVLGLNAEKSLVRAVARSDFAALPEEQRAKLPEIDTSDPYAAELTESIYGGHSAGNAGTEGFSRVQSLWDETMAESIARYLTSPQGESQRLLIVAGGNHIRNGFGIPRRTFRRLPIPFLLVGTHELQIGKDKRDRLMAVTTPPFPMPDYDFVVYTAYEDLDKEEVKLGVLLETTAGQVRVKAVLPGSAAEKAGMKEGDIVESVDGQKVSENFDIVYAISQKRPGSQMAVGIRRGDTASVVTVAFIAPQ